VQAETHSDKAEYPAMKQVYGQISFRIMGILVLIFLLGMVSGCRSYSQKANIAVGELDSKIKSLTLTVGIKPKSDIHGLRSVTLVVPGEGEIIIENSYMWADNQKPVSCHVHISSSNAGSIIRELAGLGFFDNACKLYSDRMKAGDKTPPPPKDAVEFGRVKPPVVASPSVSIKITVNDEYWYTCYEGSYPWDARSREMVHAIRSSLSYFNEGRSMIDELIGQMDSRE